MITDDAPHAGAAEITISLTTITKIALDLT